MVALRSVTKPSKSKCKPLSKSIYLVVGILCGYLLRLLTKERSHRTFLFFNPSLVPTTNTAKIRNTPKKSPFPPKCSVEDLAIVKKQLPPARCLSTTKRPWANDCSFSFATRCPDPVWLTTFYSKSISSSHPLIGIYVGCNKAMDAVNTLRMLSKNATFDRNVWRTKLVGSGKDHEAGRCGQEFGEQFVIPENTKDIHKAMVHCIEAMPVTANHLIATAQNLQWSQDHLVISNIAVSDTDGSIHFPNLDGKVGVENMGIENCSKPKNRQSKECVEVPMYRLDTYMGNTAEWANKGQLIDFLSIDVEGFDFEVLLGAEKVLQRTKYIEFEYNWKGNWKKHSLSSVIDMLKNEGFTCFWAGSSGHIWRITDCWMDYYNLKFWSNVACVNVHLAPSLSTLMEDMFQQTLKAGDAIKY